ncbi:ATP-dependent DNA helicase [Candidatus Aerophobetes bacterium]|uniref:DNA 3'-5' helicase n=1 Tax=Aerophobetes bacterium TaxID=2030807 RepID=A0A2A4X943_UNCAE|nr:MAG: ATP-dependent DNA helicase [Candidatus Aerophobetes bacterium]
MATKATTVRLNPEQRKAVLTTENKVLILAGAGSGKTRVLIERCKHLIENKNVHPSQILGLTFTNKAAGEMKHRLKASVFHKEISKVHLSTFHRFCMDILKKHIPLLGYRYPFSLYDEKDLRRLILELIDEHIPSSSSITSFEPLIQTLLFHRGQGSLVEDLPILEDKDEVALLQAVYTALPAAMRSYNALDFDSLLLLTCELFETCPEILNLYQDQYRYIMIDEYQDTSPVQSQIALTLAEKHNNLCVVGDDDQSIYGWRGAKVEHILNFPADVVIKLEHNYRSTSHILRAANSLIKNNTVRHDKELITNMGSGDTVEVFNAPTEKEEVEGVIHRILAVREKKQLPWREIAILYRSNRLAKLFELQLIQTVWKNNGQFQRGIPYEVYGGQNFFEKSEIKDILAYLKLIVNPKDYRSLLRIINYPRRGISIATINALNTEANIKNLPMYTLIQQFVQNTPAHTLNEKISSRGVSGLKLFVDQIEEAKTLFQTGPLPGKLEIFLEKIGYKKHLFSETKSEKSRKQKWENVLSCIQALKWFEEDNEGAVSLADFISNAALESDPSKKKKDGDNKLNLMTFHSAKGLEFEAVFLIGIEDHLVPHHRSISQQQIEEERRLLYVAITRAKETLCLSMARKRTTYGKLVPSTPSRFLFEIPKHLLKVTRYDTLSLP